MTPGFVDIHTHLDAQLAWDPDATSSCWHGVTSVVLGNCGVTFAPVRAGQESWLAALMESVEDIPAASILEGLAWDWETYGEYLSAIDRMPKGVNVGGMIGHCALRHYAMGERGLDEAPATDDDIAIDDRPRRRGDAGRRARLLDVAHVAAPRSRRTSGSRHVGRRARAARDRRRARPARQGCLRGRTALRASGRELRRHARRGALDGRDQPSHRSTGHVRSRAEQRRPRAVSARSSSSSTRRPRSAASCDRRRPRAASGCSSACSTARSSTARRSGPHSHRFRSTARLAVLDDPDRRAELLRVAGREHAPARVDRRVRAAPAGAVDYSADPATSLAAHAERAGESIVEAFVRISRETRGRALFNYPFLNQRMDAVEEMLDHPRMAIGLGDSGAHVGLIMDASLPTWFLLHWVRDRKKYPIEDAIRRLTSDTADLFGVADRGVLEPGSLRRRQRARPRRVGGRAPRGRARFPHRRGALHPTSAGLSRHDRERRGVRRRRLADRRARGPNPSFIGAKGATFPRAPPANITRILRASWVRKLGVVARMNYSQTFMNRR